MLLCNCSNLRNFGIRKITNWRNKMFIFVSHMTPRDLELQCRYITKMYWHSKYTKDVNGKRKFTRGHCSTSSVKAYITIRSAYVQCIESLPTDATSFSQSSSISSNISVVSQKVLPLLASRRLYLSHHCAIIILKSTRRSTVPHPWKNHYRNHYENLIHRRPCEKFYA